MDRSEVVRDKKVGRVQGTLQGTEQIENFRPCSYIEHRSRLVKHDEIGCAHDRPRDTYTLGLTPGELMREPIGNIRI